MSTLAGIPVTESEALEIGRSIREKTVTPRPDCRIWLGATDRGYGRVGVKRQSKRVHRVAWELEHGPIPEGLTIDHLCRVPMCCNTEHMELVSAAENSRRAAVAQAAAKVAASGRSARTPRSVHPIRPVASSLDAAVRVMDELIEPLGDHWVWVGFVDDRGYASAQFGSFRARPHRLLWEVNEGPLGRSHLFRTCEMTLCCNPAHHSLRSASIGRTHCPAGHELVAENLYEYPEHGIRTCRKCASQKAAERRLRKKAA